MLKFLYKIILKKLGLNQQQLMALEGRLTPDRVCAGEFVQGSRLCPNTTALGLQEEIPEGANNAQVRAMLKKYRVDWVDLLMFYLLFDLPSKLSPKYFERALVSLRAAAHELQ